MLIAGDIGGTKTLLALFEPGTGPRKPLHEVQYPSARFDSLEAVVRQFLAETGARPTHGCWDVAGPVLGGRAKLTNLPWDVSEEGLRRNLGLQDAWLLNDLKAIAYAVPLLGDADLHVLNAGKPQPQGPIGVVAPGTGLGEAFLIHDGRRYIACPSEGGHASFSPADERQARLWRHLNRIHGHVSFERVCSGMAIPGIYEFLKADGAAVEPDGFAAKLAQADDRTPLILEAALKRPGVNPLADATLATFIAILGNACGNLAVRLIATGGIYLSGGLPPRMLDRLGDGAFMDAFRNKGRFAGLMADIPVKVVTANPALMGAAAYGLDRMGG